MCLADYVVSQGIDVLAFIGTWLGTDADQLFINELIPACYEFNHTPQINGRSDSGIDIH